MIGFTVFYVEDSSPRTKWFKSELAARRFMKKFNKKHPDIDDGYWIDCLVYGRIVEDYT